MNELLVHVTGASEGLVGRGLFGVDAVAERAALPSPGGRMAVHTSDSFGP